MAYEPGLQIPISDQKTQSIWTGFFGLVGEDGFVCIIISNRK